MNRRPLIVHVLYRLDTGGMERIVVSLINRTAEHYRHAVICLDGFGALRDQLRDPQVSCRSLHKRPGKDWRCYVRLWRILRRLRPDLVTTYNLGTLDLAPVARLAGVRRLVHAEHGRDAADPGGESPRYRRLRRGVAPFVSRHVVVSPDLGRWLTGRIGIAPARVAYIANGIDVEAFHVQRPRVGPRGMLEAFAPPEACLIGHVARLDPVKNQLGLLRAFARLRACEGGAACRLVIAGEGPQRPLLEREIKQLGLGSCVRLLGTCRQIPALLRACDLFVLSSTAEGMPVTVLEAMAAGLPVVATAVGGVAEVVIGGRTGALVGAADPTALATAMHAYVRDPALRAAHGQAGYARVVRQFPVGGMAAAYVALYDQLLGTPVDTRPADPVSACPERGEH